MDVLLSYAGDKIAKMLDKRIVEHLKNGGWCRLSVTCIYGGRVCWNSMLWVAIGFIYVFCIGTMEDLHCSAPPVSPPPPAHKPDCSHPQLTTDTNTDTQSDLPPQKVLLYIILVCRYLVPNELSMLGNGNMLFNPEPTIDLFSFNSHLVQSRLKIDVTPIIAYTRLHPLVGKSYCCPIAVTQIRADLRRQQSSTIAKSCHP